MTRTHRYTVHVKWTGNKGAGTTNYRAYDRSHEISSSQKQVILGSSDPTFRGDASRWNPEELLVASLSSCHELWYLHLCAVNSIVVLEYDDDPEGFMEESADGSGMFAKVILKPKVKVSPGSDAEKALALHSQAQEKCFIANSVNFPVEHEAKILA